MLLSKLKKSRYFSVGDQIILSAANFLSSILVLSAGGVAQLGVFSFVFVLSSLVANSIDTLLHRQMMLHISASAIQKKRKIFKSSFVLQLMLIFIFACLVSIFCLSFFKKNILEYPGLFISTILYIYSFTIYELFRNYLYISNKYYHSLRVTVIFLVTYSLCGVLIFIFVSENVETFVFLSLFFGFTVAVVANKFAWKNMGLAGTASIKDVIQLCSYYFKSGKFALGGMALSWIQLKSINPILMFLGGALAAGYFSIARMIVLPALVFNHGLLISSAPRMRRAYKKSNIARLDELLKKELQNILLFYCLMLVAIFFLYMSGLFYHFVPDFDNVKEYLFVWLIVSLITLQRSWVTQFFIIRAEFIYLLRINVIVVGILAILYVCFSLATESLPLVLTSVALAEVLLTVILSKRKRALCASKPSTSD